MCIVVHVTLHSTGTQWNDDPPVLLPANPNCPVKHGTTVCMNWRGCTREPVHLQRMLCVMPAGMLSVQASADMLGSISAGIATWVCWLGPYMNDVGQDTQLVLALHGWKKLHTIMQYPSMMLVIFLHSLLP